MGAGSVCINASPGGQGKDMFEEIESKLVRTSSSVCISGSYSYSWGWPVGACALKFAVKLGVAIDGCSNLQNVFTSFHIYIAAEICLGGVIADIADALGWDACKEIAKLKYYPFIGKITASMGLPTFLPMVYGNLVVSAPVHSLTKPVRDYINTKTNAAWAIRTAKNLCSLTRRLGINNYLCRGSLPGKGYGRFSGKSQGRIVKDVRSFYEQEFLNARGSLDIDLEIK